MTHTPAAAVPKPRRTARDRLVRRGRIMDRLREGRSYEEIAQAEGLSRERIRQIVVKALEQRDVDTQRDHAQLQMLRLAPALRLAANGVAEGDLKSVAELIRVLDRLDKYQATSAAATSDYYEGGRARLLNKLDTMARRMGFGPRLEAARARYDAAEKERAAANGQAAADAFRSYENSEEEGASEPAAHPWGLKP